MAISLQTRRMLWARSGNRCAFPSCEQFLVQDVGESGRASVVGEEAHIVAKEPAGPRGDWPLTLDQRDGYLNLILMCSIHHKVIDDHPDQFDVPKLRDLKRTHEEKMLSQESPERTAQRVDEERYAGYVDEWSWRAGLESWTSWASELTSHGQPSMAISRFDQLDELRRWLLGRIWPGRHILLEESLHNFRFVLGDLLTVFQRHIHDDGDVLWIEKFYKSSGWTSQKQYHRLLREYEDHVDLVEDLSLELTRAANYVCDRVRESIDPTFRIEEGVLLIQSGPDMSLRWQTLRPEYRGDERSDRPYSGLEEFMSIRSGRDFAFGEARDEDEDLTSS